MERGREIGKEGWIDVGVEGQREGEREGRKEGGREGSQKLAIPFQSLPPYQEPTFSQKAHLLRILPLSNNTP